MLTSGFLMRSARALRARYGQDIVEYALVAGFVALATAAISPSVIDAAIESFGRMF